MSAVDGVLSPEEDADLQSHLSVCARCRSIYEAHKRIQHTISSEVEPPDALVDSVMDQIRNEKRVSIFRNKRFTIVAAAAVLLLVVASRFNWQTPTASTISSPGSSISITDEEIPMAALAPGLSDKGTALTQYLEALGYSGTLVYVSELPEQSLGNMDYAVLHADTGETIYVISQDAYKSIQKELSIIESFSLGNAEQEDVYLVPSEKK